jgi:hypothetical protein
VRLDVLMVMSVEITVDAIFRDPFVALKWRRHILPNHRQISTDYLVTYPEGEDTSLIWTVFPIKQVAISVQTVICIQF